MTREGKAVGTTENRGARSRREVSGTEPGGRRVVTLGSPGTGLYQAHPLLDPFLPRRAPGLARLWVETRRRLRRGTPTVSENPTCLPGSCGQPQAPYQSVEAYLHDADSYLDDVLHLLANPESDQLRLLPRTRAVNDTANLLDLCFDGPDPRTRYEAQRKLYLAKLLFTIDHCRAVRDGHRHKEILQAHIERSLLSTALAGPELEVCCLFEPSAGGGGRLRVVEERSPDARCWRFRILEFPGVGADPGIDVFHYVCRFKRDTVPVAPTRTDEGYLQLGEAPRWPSLGRRSGSILSKMITRGITDPNLVQDILGAMFIVADRKQAYALERRLLEVLGGAGGMRDRIDTLAGERDRHRLTRRSAGEFHVLKEVVDVLIADAAAETPYLFAVELQIYPLEAYLETIHDAHYASHTAYKRRQFLFDLLPLLFPTAVYGDHTRLTAPQPQARLRQG